MKNSQHTTHRREAGRGKGWKKYFPLIVLLGGTALAATASNLSHVSPDPMRWMHDFMGFFLVVFSMFKFFDLAGFADGFQMYDLLAKRVRPYAYIYPVLELALGLAYLSGRGLQITYIATIVLMLFGAMGVFQALLRGLDVNCACMGNILKVPLSTVALTEDLGMAVMAGAMMVSALRA